MSYVDAVLAFAFACAALAIPTLAFCLHVSRLRLVPAPAIAAVALAGTSVLGYATFWLTFWEPGAGVVARWALIAVSLSAIVPLLARKNAGVGHREWLLPLGLMVVVGIASISALYAWGGKTDGYTLSATRFTHLLPIDNAIPELFADRIEHDQPLQPFLGDEWLTSDRPPLQAALIVAVRPSMAALGYPTDNAGYAVSVIFQLVWIPGVWAVLRTLRATRQLSIAVIGLTAASGFALLNTTFTWPKLGAAGFLLAAWSLMITPRAEARSWAIAGGLTALAYLSHGAVAYSIVGLVVLFASRKFRPRASYLFAAATVFALLVVPWAAYQRFVDPPGNRLMKWHLAGVVPIDDRGLMETLVDSYSAEGVDGTLSNKWSNFVQAFDPTYPLPPFFNTLQRAREDEFYAPVRAIGTGSLFLILLPAALLRGPRLLSRSRFLVTMAWCGATLVAWCLLVFESDWILVHTASYAMLLPLIALPAAAVRIWSRWIYVVAATIQFALFLNWIPRAQGVTGTFQLAPTVVAISIFAALVCVGARTDRRLGLSHEQHALSRRATPGGSGPARGADESPEDTAAIRTPW